MSLYLTAQEDAEIWAEAQQHCPPVTSSDSLETVAMLIKIIGLVRVGVRPCVFNTDSP